MRRLTGVTAPLVDTDAAHPVLAAESQQYLNAFTVDVEDYFQVSAFENDVDRRRWDSYECRVEDNTLRLMDRLAAHNVRATFFVVGWVGERYPQLIARIRREGHEVGSHSYWHRLVYRLTPAEFREDLSRSRKILEDILGEPIRIFRAPSFSITSRSLWALEILVEEGFTADSSVFPVYHDRYGVPNAEPAIHRWQTPSGWLWECPPSVTRVAGLNLPVSGGGYFRLYPVRLSLRWLAKVNQVHHRPFVFYLHPWEIDPEQPRLNAGSPLSRWRHYMNLQTTESKLIRLLERFQFSTISQVISACQVRCSPYVSSRAHAAEISQRPA